MPDKYNLDYFEASFQITCGVCDETFWDFPDLEHRIMACPRCDRQYKVRIVVKPIDHVEIIKKSIRAHLTQPPTLE